jgi:predicted HTH domain antitoxin
MDTVKVEVPSDLLKLANLEPSNLSEEAVRLLALELFREEKLSLGRAAELSRTPLAAFMEFAFHLCAIPPLIWSRNVASSIS